ncbi:MAG TPA: hypothetical protein VGI95_21325 [Caulobacteraceae bacterium]|jgi:hypothetical protein
MIRAAAVPAVLLALLLAACSGPVAPQADGVCWRMTRAPGGEARFTQLASGIQSLENCTVLLEAVRLQGAPEADGAYQGYYIFVTPTVMSSGMHLDGLRYPVFQPPQRVTIDRDLRRMMAERGGRLPDAADISIERK